MKWTIKKTIPTMAVPDLDVGIAFYTKLGFETEWQWPEDSPTHAGLVLDACSIMLSLCDPAVNADVYFIVDDVEACHASVLEGKSWEMAAAAGALVKNSNGPPKRSLVAPAPPKATEYGLRDFSVIDPWGHSLSFGQENRGQGES